MWREDARVRECESVYDDIRTALRSMGHGRLAAEYVYVGRSTIALWGINRFQWNYHHQLSHNIHNKMAQLSPWCPLALNLSFYFSLFVTVRCTCCAVMLLLSIFAIAEPSIWYLIMMACDRVMLPASRPHECPTFWSTTIIIAHTAIDAFVVVCRVDKILV